MKHDSVLGVMLVRCESVHDSRLQIEVRVFSRVGTVRAGGTGNRVCVEAGNWTEKDTGNGVCGVTSGRAVEDTGNWVCTPVVSRSVCDGGLASRRYNGCRGDGTGNGVWGLAGRRSGVSVGTSTCSGNRGGELGR